MENKPAVLAEYDNKARLYRLFVSEIEHLLKGVLREEAIECNAITSRLKDRDSLSKKIDRKQDKYKSLGELTDIAGVRIITYYTEDVDKVAEIVEREFAVDRENSIDKREALEPDRFGYCSVHYVVAMNPDRLNLREYQAFAGLKCEIQIRSVLQHAWAEIEHDLGYKSEVGIPKNIRRNFSRLAGLLEIADKEFQEIRSFLQSYQEEAVQKIQNEELIDNEIDAVLLQASITTDKDITELNKEIAKLFRKEFRDPLSIVDLEGLITELHWFKIEKVTQLQDFISKNKKVALEIAKQFISGSEKSESSYIKETVAFFYLCYAELVSGNYGFEEILSYLSELNIGADQEDQEQTAKDLLQIRAKLKTSGLL